MTCFNFVWFCTGLALFASESSYYTVVYIILLCCISNMRLLFQSVIWLDYRTRAWFRVTVSSLCVNTRQIRRVLDFTMLALLGYLETLVETRPKLLKRTINYRHIFKVQFLYVYLYTVRRVLTRRDSSACPPPFYPL